MSTKYVKIIEAQRVFFKTGGTRPIEKRIERLENLKRMINENIERIAIAYEKDLGRGLKVAEMERSITLSRIDHQINNLEEWSKPIELPLSPPLSTENGDSLYLVKESLGVVLNIAPWNGPVTSLASNMYAIAAGNTVVFKPSEMAPAIASLWEELAPKYFEQNFFAVITGGVEETTDLLKERFDHIFYTGSTAVAKIIMGAAAKNLTPVTLELGGKNPVFIDDSADISHAVTQLLGGKQMGAGQICVCPDYILVTPKAKKEIVDEFKKRISNLGELNKNEFFGKIVHERAFDRLDSLIKSSKGVIVASSGTPDRSSLHYPLTIVEVPVDDSLMQEELFGPIFPLHEVSSMEEALDIIHSKEKPLAAYAFTSHSNIAHRFVENTWSGGVTINDVMIHTSSPLVPFGGVGHSGIGRIMGKYGFDTFTHEKGVAMRKGTKLSL
ncbi:hypothetical protein PRIPAC_77640 [Pristionchus pacificus]|uniref:Aldehyde dehydrogenase n=1 Tax=Pristionchus pacificus TaxID=54126 RepID=A0A2A6BE28_PRIPA|nr:hypothetical protein PRIPAC_77640 [Pristionchus pacificus]|eukprot:PDM64124.1 hypothetical protein PRIPAC_54368 [Pristionchus pacificus]